MKPPLAQDARPAGRAWAGRRSLAGRSRRWQWIALLLASASAVVLLEVARVPGAFLLGPMLAAILVGMSQGTIAVPVAPFVLAQGFVGCLMARSIPPAVLAELLRDWPVLVGVPLCVIVAAGVLGAALTRWRVLPGTAAIWGSSPGAATAMTLMSEAYGADIRLVAVMQYLRMACVALVASMVARAWTVTTGHPPAVDWFAAVAWRAFLETALLAGAGAWLAHRLSIPAGPLLAPLAIGVVLQATGAMTLALPPWLLGASYAVVGWSIGLRFTPAIVAHAARALPHIVASIVILMAVCAAIAGVLCVTAHVDPLTAYLATSPGGADAVAIIAASTNVDLPFVMAMQTTRFVLVALTGPTMARVLARWMLGPASQDPAARPRAA